MGASSRSGLLHHGVVQAFELVDRPAPAPSPAIRRNNSVTSDRRPPGWSRAPRPSRRSPSPWPSCRGSPGRAPRCRLAPRGARRSWDPRCYRPRGPRGSRGRVRRPGPSGPSAGRPARCGRRPSSARAYASSSWADRTTTPVPGWACGSRAHSRCPPDWNDGGILMSVTTTSGTCSAAVSSSVGASAATPTTSMSSWSRAARGHPREPGRCRRPGPPGCSRHALRPLDAPCTIRA